ncbi:MAG: hypothetical protein R2939_16790 [Kofleriaceae bacterium]
MLRLCTPTLLVALASGCGGSPTTTTTAAGNTAPAAPTLPAIAQLTPSYLPGVYLGMPEAAFLAARPGATPDGPVDPDDFRATFVEREPAPGVKEITYYVSRQVDEPRLYELIIDHAEQPAAIAAYDAVAADGEPVSGETMPTVHFSGYDAPTRVWRFNRALVLAIALPGSEWDGEWADAPVADQDDEW